MVMDKRNFLNINNVKSLAIFFKFRPTRPFKVCGANLRKLSY